MLINRQRLELFRDPERVGGQEFNERGGTMRASDVNVLKAPDPGEAYTDPDFLLVETLPDRHGHTRTTIDRIYACGQRGKAWAVKAVDASPTIGHSAAREWAVSYAAANGIPVVYERDLMA